jgi:polysaccharide export outer membrane protein
MNVKYWRNFFLFFLPVVFFVSCKSIPNNISYFEDLRRDNNIDSIKSIRNNGLLRILPDNYLSIVVSSSNPLDTRILEQFNLLPLTSVDPAIVKSSTEMRFQNYCVDENGNINFPVLGEIHVADLTFSELQSMLEQRLQQWISNPIVNVNINSNRVFVYGEVASPGPVMIGNRLSLSVLDIIAHCGDITTYGNKKNVLVMRENNGIMEYASLDLTSTAVFSSPYFYLKQNDIVIVDYNETRKKDTLYGNADNYRLSVISMIMGTASLIASAIITIVSINSKSTK